jgi:flagellar basal body-associated protein FliL
VDDQQSRGKAKAIIAIIAVIAVLVLGAMLLIGLIQGDEVDREENPVRGIAAAAPLSPRG